MSASPPTQVQAGVALRHTLLEDAQAMVAGTMMVSLGVALVGKVGLVTGGIVGLGVLLQYVTGVSFGKLFLVLNLPFYVLALKKMGWRFTAKTFTAVLLLSAFSELVPTVLELNAVAPLYAAIMGGLLMGTGLLVLFRHQASLGGFNILALYLQNCFGWRAGLVQLGLDLTLLLSAALLLPPAAVAASLACAVVLNLCLAVNHRPGRYTGA
jgi:uncharacterized membrane-anchored protein YitT (DUF2179 family)